MPERTDIDAWIEEALAHTGVPLSRRAEMAEEWRVHLDQLVEADRGAGVSDKQAGEAALVSFGSPKLIRRQLARAQRALDRRESLCAVRRTMWLLLPLPLVPLVLVVLWMAARGPHPVWQVALAALPLLFFLWLTAAALVFAASQTCTRLLRPRPLAELNFLPRLCHWIAAGLMVSVLLAAAPILELAFAYPLLHQQDWFGQVGFWTLSRFYATDLGWRGGGASTLLASGLLCAVAATVYERHRGVSAGV